MVKLGCPMARDQQEVLSMTQRFEMGVGVGAGGLGLAFLQYIGCLLRSGIMTVMPRLFQF